MPESTSLTPYPDVNDAVETLLRDTQNVLGAQFIGMYLTGSLACGDFDPDDSDIDLLVVTAGDLPDVLAAALRAMHVRFSASGSPWSFQVECHYVPRSALTHPDDARASYLRLDRGDSVLETRQHDADWDVQRHLLYEHAITVAGPAVRSMLDPVEAPELQLAVIASVYDWGVTLTRDPEPIRDVGYLGFVAATMCRVLYTLEHGSIVSKPIAARWLQSEIGDSADALIDGILSRKMRHVQDRRSSESDIDDTLSLIRHTLYQCDRWEARHAGQIS